MLKAGVCQGLPLCGVVMLHALLHFAFNSCIVELYIQTHRSQGSASDVVAYNGFHVAFSISKPER